MRALASYMNRLMYKIEYIAVFTSDSSRAFGFNSCLRDASRASHVIANCSFSVARIVVQQLAVAVGADPIVQQPSKHVQAKFILGSMRVLAKNMLH